VVVTSYYNTQRVATDRTVVRNKQSFEELSFFVAGRDNIEKSRSLSDDKRTLFDLMRVSVRNDRTGRRVRIH
jgi:hypothetical protein